MAQWHQPKFHKINVNPQFVKKSVFNGLSLALNLQRGTEYIAVNLTFHPKHPKVIHLTRFPDLFYLYLGHWLELLPGKLKHLF